MWAVELHFVGCCGRRFRGSQRDGAALRLPNRKLQTGLLHDSSPSGRIGEGSCGHAATSEFRRSSDANARVVALGFLVVDGHMLIWYLMLHPMYAARSCWSRSCLGGDECPACGACGGLVPIQGGTDRAQRGGMAKPRWHGQA